MSSRKIHIFNHKQGILVILIIALLLIVVGLGGFFAFRYIWPSRQQEVIVFKEDKVLVEEEKEKKEEGKDIPIVEEVKLVEKDKSKKDERVELQKLSKKIETLIIETQRLAKKTQRFIEEKEERRQKAIQQARERSAEIKGVYMTEFIANSQNPVAIRTREDIMKLLDETELNGIVIDVKEAYGPNLPSSLKKLIKELHQKDIWVIARIVVFRDGSLTEQNPELYLKIKEQSTSTTSATSTTSEFWRDNQGAYWLDPASQEVWKYILDFSKKAIDFGFDELQFDYIRFPSDGDLENIVYPVYDGKKKKSDIIQEFSNYLSQNSKSYQPSIILSVDLFGLIATTFGIPETGQRLFDMETSFDYISFMLYPSHFYDGFMVQEDLKRGLPSLYFPYDSKDISQVVSNHPYEVVLRSIFSASDYLSSRGSKAKIRPWLQDFNLKPDTKRGIYYDAQKVQAQIKAAQDAGASGWLLWNPSNVYTKDAFVE